MDNLNEFGFEPNEKLGRENINDGVTQIYDLPPNQSNALEKVKVIWAANDPERLIRFLILDICKKNNFLLNDFLDHPHTRQAQECLKDIKMQIEFYANEYSEKIWDLKINEVRLSMQRTYMTEEILRGREKRDRESRKRLITNEPYLTQYIWLRGVKDLAQLEQERVRKFGPNITNVSVSESWELIKLNLEQGPLGLFINPEIKLEETELEKVKLKIRNFINITETFANNFFNITQATESALKTLDEIFHLRSDLDYETRMQVRVFIVNLLIEEISNLTIS